MILCNTALEHFLFHKHQNSLLQRFALIRNRPLYQVDTRSISLHGRELLLTVTGSSSVPCAIFCPMRKSESWSVRNVIWHRLRVPHGNPVSVRYIFMPAALKNHSVQQQRFRSDALKTLQLDGMACMPSRGCSA